MVYNVNISFIAVRAMNSIDLSIDHDTGNESGGKSSPVTKMERTVCVDYERGEKVGQQREGV